MIRIDSVEGESETFSLDIKRCYLPFVIVATCPTCGEEVRRDLSEDYLGYPRVGAAFDVAVYHENEDGAYWHHEWKERIVLRLTVEAAP